MLKPITTNFCKMAQTSFVKIAINKLEIYSSGKTARLKSKKIKKQ